MGKVVVMDHPLIQHKIGLMRRTETGSKDFRTLAGEVAMFECYEATRDLELQDVEIETPICKTTVKELKGKKLAVVPILRAGLGMVDGMLEMILCQPRSICRRSDVGYRRISHRGNPDAERQGCKKHSFYVHHCCTGRCKSTYRCSPGC